MAMHTVHPHASTYSALGYQKIKKAVCNATIQAWGISNFPSSA